ncbi:hypothetical protein HB662_26885 [Roseomonas frigidaquae]|uniref:Uncharacterized protein n=1 Tax=Falsiroseomonas frigidaquae TaxID=487318 RepID=A0ABX1F7Z3_9PROT|nr:hypothetical protein [Falsiroseomonas frigidaquae]NKE48428.1 hypothetical protein [Falsiroseomonas frigidaquae]
MKPSEALRRILARSAEEWEKSLPQVRINGVVSRVTTDAPEVFSPSDMRGTTVSMSSVDTGRFDLSAPWALRALGGACASRSVEIVSMYDGLLFRTHRVVSFDGRGGLPLPVPQTMVVERDRYLFLRLMAEVSGTPGFDEAWVKSGLALADMPWRGEGDETPPPAWSPVTRRFA